MDTLYLLQHYWWAVVSLLGALLVFLMFVQGGQTFLFGITNEEKEKQILITLLGHKWEITYTTLVTFGGAAFASFPLFYSTSFGGAYWLWLLILFLFVIQAVSYEFRNKENNLLGKGTYDLLLFLNGTLGTFLIGVAVGTLFSGGAYYMDKGNASNLLAPTISYWANGWKGLDALADPFNLLLGFTVLAAARTLGLLYIRRNLDSMPAFRKKYKSQLVFAATAFVVLFVAFVLALVLRTGYAADPATGNITAVEYKYGLNLLQLVWPAILLVLGTVLVLLGLGAALFRENSRPAACSFYITGAGTVLAVWAILICAAYNGTAFFPSTADVQNSLTLQNSSSSLYTLKAMAYVSILVPFVAGYIAYTWNMLQSKKDA